jgi:hypothetical protein
MTTASRFDDDVYDGILVERSDSSKLILNALDIVKNNVIRRKLLLTGGMAIDLALRLKGSKIYGDHEIPDYDFYSKNFHTDAYDIARELMKNGYEVSAINAMHASTMRVITHFQAVADVTYMPAQVWDNIPFVMYKNLKLVHPHYQMIDQHISLSKPFVNAPKETIFHRWRKDITRHSLIIKSYPIDIDLKTPKEIKWNNKSVHVALDELKDQCIGGIPAVQYWYTKAVLYGFKPDPVMDKYVDGFQIDEKSITASAPFTLYSHNGYEKRLKFKGKHVRMNSVLEKIPVRYILGDYEIFEEKALICAHKYSGSKQVWIAAPQTVLTHLLTMKVIYKIALHSQLYEILRRIVSWAVTQFNNTDNLAEHKKLLEFLPNTSVYGDPSHKPFNYTLYRAKHSFQLGGERPQQVRPMRLFERNWDTEKMKKAYLFKPEESPIYKFDGQESKTTDQESKTNPQIIIAESV